MPTNTVPERLKKAYAMPPVDEGLRSASGIRWLHWIGALVIGVSVVGLLAARWGELPRAAQFLVLVAGALGVQAAGDVARHRLRLPATGSALYFLFTALVPLLAWGAAYLDLVEATFGWLALGLGLGALQWASRRVLERVLGYRGWIYPAALGTLLSAVPVLPWVEGRVAVDPRALFLGAAIVLGLVLRFASRHVNRFFFHRDRVAGEDRPVHFLPFALLALTYAAAMSLHPVFATHLAVPLVFLAVALVDTGEEYFRALVEATGKVPERWPRRSVGLLASGFAAMAVAAAASFAEPTLRAAALVAVVASLRLFAWALAYRRVPAYACALASSLAAYHLAPALIPDFVRQLFWHLVAAAGIRPGSPAVVSLADLGALAGLLALGALLGWRGKLTVAMRQTHAAAVTFQGLVVLGAALTDPAAARILAPLAAALLGAGLLALRRAEVVPVFFLAVAHAAAVWAAPLLGTPAAQTFAGLWTAETMVVLAAVHLAFAAAVLGGRRRRPELLAGSARWSAAAPAGGAAAALFVVVTLFDLPALTTLTLLSAASTVLLAGLALDDGSALARLARRDKTWQGLAVTAALIFPGSTAFFLALALAAFELARAWDRDSGDAAARLAGWWLQGWIALAVVEAVAAGWIFVGHRLAALALVAAAVAERVAAEALERRGRCELVRAAYPVAWALAALAGALAVATTLEAHGVSWWTILPGFLASLFFLLQARDGYARVASALAAMAFFVASTTVLFAHLTLVGPELYWLAPGLALIGLSRLLGREIGERWSARLFTVGAGCLYAMPVLGLLDELAWGWQIVMLLLAIAFGAASFHLKSRSLLTLSTAAAVIDLGFFLLKLGQTAPLALWAVGIFFGLALMGCATLLEYRRELLLQKIRVWGREIRSWA